MQSSSSSMTYWTVEAVVDDAMQINDESNDMLESDCLRLDLEQWTPDSLWYSSVLGTMLLAFANTWRPPCRLWANNASSSAFLVCMMPTKLFWERGWNCPPFRRHWDCIPSMISSNIRVSLSSARYARLSISRSDAEWWTCDFGRGIGSLCFMEMIQLDDVWSGVFLKWWMINGNDRMWYRCHWTALYWLTMVSSVRWPLTHERHGF